MKPEVLIVGAGPVELTMAIELFRYKVPDTHHRQNASAERQIQGTGDLEPQP
jgi:hypothetical protein